MNIPNLLTILRIFFVPLLVAALVQERVALHFRGATITNVWLALAIFLCAASTDLLDGYLARRWRQITTIGTLLDPIANIFKGSRDTGDDQGEQEECVSKANCAPGRRGSWLPLRQREIRAHHGLHRVSSKVWHLRTSNCLRCRHASAPYRITEELQATR